MEEKITEKREDENLNSDEKTTYTLEEVEAIKKKMQSDSEKWVQKLINETKQEKQQRLIYERVLDEVWKVADDNSYLISLYEEEPEVANIILGKYYDWQSIEQFKDSIWYEEDYNDPKVRERKISLEVKKLADKQLIESKKQEFISKLKMTEEERLLFEEAFDERKQLKSFNVNDVEKHLEKAYREVNENAYDFKSQETIAKTMATWEWKSWNNKETRNSISDEANAFLDKFL